MCANMYASMRYVSPEKVLGAGSVYTFTKSTVSDSYQKQHNRQTSERKCRGRISMHTARTGQTKSQRRAGLGAGRFPQTPIVILRSLVSHVPSCISLRPSLVEGVNGVCGVNHCHTMLVRNRWHRLVVCNIPHDEIRKRTPVECSCGYVMIYG